MNEKDLAETRSTIEKILQAFGVDRVVFVDDANGNGVPVEEVIAAANGLDPAVLLRALPELNDVPDDLDVLARKIRGLWEEIAPELRSERGQAVVVAARLQDGGEIDDRADISILNQLIPKDRLVNLSPAQWEADQGRLLQESRESRTLFLFDRDFGNDSDGGIKIISSLLAREDTETLICALLTHTVTPDTQPQKWDELSETYGIPKDRFIVIPKLHLSKTPMLFAQTLKFAALSPDFTELKRKTKEIIEGAAAVAAGRVEKVNIYDLDHIVFRISEAEGLWEPDMLFRLHAMFYRLEALKRAHEGGTLENIAAKLRAVSGIPVNCDAFPTPGSAWTLQREELYESQDYINANYLPLELGDIFARVGGDSVKKYILLAQPCDLMVRSSGKRQPELLRIPLAEVVLDPRDTPPAYSEMMPYFDESPENKWYVRLKMVHFVRGCLLDLCVFNEDGIAKIAIGGEAPQGIRPAWKKRHGRLSSCWSRAVRSADKLAIVANESRDLSQFKQEISKDLIGSLLGDDLFKGRIEEAGGVRSIVFDCKRVGRLSRARAIGLLMSYTATLGRPAHEREFGR